MDERTMGYIYGVLVNVYERSLTVDDATEMIRKRLSRETVHGQEIQPASQD